MTHANVGGFFGGIADAFKSAFSDAQSLVPVPPGVKLPFSPAADQRGWSRNWEGRAFSHPSHGVEESSRWRARTARGNRHPGRVKMSGVVDPLYTQGSMSIEHFRHAALQAVIDAQHQQASPVYGYLRIGPHQKVYLFGSEPDAHAWFDQRATVEPHFDYIAVFVAEHPAPVVEDLGAVSVVGHDPTEVGHWFLPLALGVPAGALGGYYYRKWQEGHPGQLIPGIAGHPTVGQHWGAHLLGADVSSQVPSSWPQTHALIKAAIHETVARGAPSEIAFVWSLETDGSTHVVPFGSYEQALDYMRDRIHTDHVALAAFSRRSRHWPNPLNWTKQDDPRYVPVIAQHVARHAPQVAGDVVGTYPWYNIVGGLPWQSIVGGLPWQSIVGTGPWGTIVGDAIADVRAKAQDIATQKPGHAVGVIHAADGQWHALAFNTLDDADDWFGTATQDKTSFTYAAYYDKDPNGGAFVANEEIGGVRKALAPGPLIRRGLATAA